MGADAATRIGRPKKWESPADMQVAIDEYFDTCDAEERPYTVTGLALALDFTSREALINYESRPGYEAFFDTIKKAKLRVHSYVERHLFGPTQVAGAIFNLKNNFGWVDRQEVAVSAQLEYRISLPSLPGMATDADIIDVQPIRDALPGGDGCSAGHGDTSGDADADGS